MLLRCLGSMKTLMRGQDIAETRCDSESGDVAVTLKATGSYSTLDFTRLHGSFQIDMSTLKSS